MTFSYLIKLSFTEEKATGVQWQHYLNRGGQLMLIPQSALALATRVSGFFLYD